MNYTIVSYSIYLPVAIALTIWVANKLLSNAKVFYMDIFHGQNEQAYSLNKLIQVGFYLIGLGFAFLRLEITPKWESGVNGETGHQHYISTIQEVIETLSMKVGGFVVFLGVMLFLNLILVLSQRSASNRIKALSASRPKIEEVK